MNRIASRTAALVTVLLITLPAMATLPPWEYRIKLTKNLDGLNITAHSFAGPAVTIGLENRSDVTAYCGASFVGYPHPPSEDEIVRASIPAGKRATLAYPLEKLGANISTAFVELTCARTKPVK